MSSCATGKSMMHLPTRVQLHPRATVVAKHQLPQLPQLPHHTARQAAVAAAAPHHQHQQIKNVHLNHITNNTQFKSNATTTTSPQSQSLVSSFVHSARAHTHTKEAKTAATGKIPNSPNVREEYAPTPKFLSSPRTVAVIGAPISLGQPFEGVDEGPTAIRAAGLSKSIISEDWRVVDRGNLDFVRFRSSVSEGNIKNSKAVGDSNHSLAIAVEKEALAGNFCLTLGGDHSIAIGSISGILKARPDVGVLWVDAHTDINTHQTTLSGNIHGMAVAFLMNLAHIRSLTGFSWMHDVPKLGLDQIVYVGSRDIDPAERGILKELKIKVYTMQEIDRYGIGKVMEMSLDYLAKKDRPLHLSVDIDSVDPFLAPSTGTKVRGGLSFREANFICEAMAETGSLGSMDMVEVNPFLSREGNDMTVDMALQMITSALGKRIL